MGPESAVAAAPNWALRDLERYARDLQHNPRVQYFLKFSEQNAVAPRYRCPVSGLPLQNPVRLGGTLYDLRSLLRLPGSADGLLKDPVSRREYRLDQIQKAPDIVADYERFAGAMERSDLGHKQNCRAFSRAITSYLRLSINGVQEAVFCEIALDCYPESSNLTIERLNNILNRANLKDLFRPEGLFGGFFHAQTSKAFSLIKQLYQGLGVNDLNMDNIKNKIFPDPRRYEIIMPIIPAPLFGPAHERFLRADLEQIGALAPWEEPAAGAGAAPGGPAFG